MSGKSGTDSFDELVSSALPPLVSEATMERGRLYRSVMARVELPLLRHALELCGGNQLKAAKLLGINRNTLRKRLRLLGLLPTVGTNGVNARSGVRSA
jgi:two-component system nitrogen regulation response regulator GlnG